MTVEEPEKSPNVLRRLRSEVLKGGAARLNRARPTRKQQFPQLSRLHLIVFRPKMSHLSLSPGAVSIWNTPELCCAINTLLEMAGAGVREMS